MRNIAYFFIVTVGVVLVLIYGQNILIQLIIALLLWFTTIRLKKLAHKIKFFDKIVPDKLELILILSLLLLLVYFILNSVVGSLSGLIASFSAYENNINSIVLKINELFNINLETQINSIIHSLDIKNILSKLAASLSNILSQSMMILIYLLFILLETDSFKLKLDALFPESSNREKVSAILEKIELSLASYFRVKTLMSLLTAFLSFVVLYLVGVKSPIFWAFLIFILNYIPTIGSLVATVFTAVFALLQFGSFIPFAIVLICIVIIQQVVGNIIEPRLMGKNLNISPIVTILALAIWGKIWGIMGMLLSVPITVIMIIILSQFKSTQKAAILLSEKGKLSLNKIEE
ncbi:MAG: AI-2E family transporter [Arcobacter sp.]|nr:AI-2E family transporter [Arcobacter sp.]